MAVKTFTIPVVWQTVKTVSIEANSLDEAMKIALDTTALNEGESLTGTLEIDTGSAEYEELEKEWLK